MALDFQNYLYSSSPPDFELFTPLYLGKRRRSPPKIATRKLAVCKEDDGCVDASFQQLQLNDSDVSDDILYEEYGVDVVGLTKCKDRSVVLVLLIHVASQCPNSERLVL